MAAFWDSGRLCLAHLLFLVRGLERSQAQTGNRTSEMETIRFFKQYFEFKANFMHECHTCVVSLSFLNSSLPHLDWNSKAFFWDSGEALHGSFVVPCLRIREVTGPNRKQNF